MNNDQVTQERARSAQSQPRPHGADVRVLEDVAYGSDASQRLDVYLPPAANNAPILLMVHGGAWQHGDKAASAVVTNKVGHWLPKGYILVSANYRLSPPDPLAQAQDVGRALAFVQAQAQQWGGDPQRVVLIGHSSGAHVVSLLASGVPTDSTDGPPVWLGTVALDSAAFDVAKIMGRRHFRFYDDVFGDDPAYWRATSPLHRLSVAPKPMLVVCSSDRRASCPQARGFVQKVEQLGGRAQMLPIALSHKQINEQLGLPGRYTDAVDSFLHSLGLP